MLSRNCFHTSISHEGAPPAPKKFENVDMSRGIFVEVDAQIRAEVKNDWRSIAD